MKEYKIKKDTIANARDGQIIIKVGKMPKGSILNQKDILDFFDLTEHDDGFSEWFEEIEPKEFTRSDMMEFVYFAKVSHFTTYDNLLNSFLSKRSKQNE